MAWVLNAFLYLIGCFFESGIGDVLLKEKHFGNKLHMKV